MIDIGFDVDGVLADFTTPYRDLLVEVTGKDLFPADYPIANPPVWHFEKALGYTNKDLDRVWAAIRASGNFWGQARPLPGMSALKRVYDGGLRRENFYFITARPGASAKRQTEVWLQNQGILLPTVLMSAAKGQCADALGLDYYIDDKLENYWDVETVAGGITASSLLDYAHNRTPEMREHRVASVQEFLDLIDR